METRSHHTRIRKWAWRGHKALLELMPLHAGLNEIVVDHRHKRALMLLSTACLGNSESALFLLAGIRLWEAEIMMRSIVEGTAKFAYILESPATIVQRSIEYRDVLPTISKLRWHAKAVAALAALGNDGSVGQQPFRDLLLSESEVAEIRAAYPRDMRRNVERRWGFTELIAAISKPGGAFGPVGEALLHSYSVSSHLIHMSYEGVDMPLERDQRNHQRREAVELAHAARLISDCFQFTFLRAGAIFRFLGKPEMSLFDIQNRHSKLFEELRQATRDWEETEYSKSAHTK